MDRRKAEIPHMVGATPFIEENIPGGPSLGPRIEIVDHRPAVRLSQAPTAIRRRIEARRRALSKEDALAGAAPAHHLPAAEHLLSARPILMPVNSAPPDLLR